MMELAIQQSRMVLAAFNFDDENSCCNVRLLKGGTWFRIVFIRWDLNIEGWFIYGFTATSLVCSVNYSLGNKAYQDRIITWPQVVRIYVANV